MKSRTVAFEAYLREAAGGRNGLLRLVAAILLIILSYAIPVALAVPLVIGGGWSPAEDESRIGIAIALLSVAWLIPATALALRLVHRRRPAGILGIAGAVSLRQFGRGFLTTMIVMVAATLVGLAYDPRIAHGPASIGTWWHSRPSSSS